MSGFCYDFHIHSCLSPCADETMTPNNLVNMACITGCDAIAITDHNTCKNAEAVMRVGEEAGLLVIPGMELCVEEEIHVVCLFETLEGALGFDAYVDARRMRIKNEPHIFGDQIIMDSADQIIGREEDLLLTATSIGLSEVSAIAAGFGGVAFPAHIDRDAYSVLSVLAGIPEEDGFTAVEATYPCNWESLSVLYPDIRRYPILRSSDAHTLETLAGEKCRANFSLLSSNAIIAEIRQGTFLCE